MSTVIHKTRGEHSPKSLRQSSSIGACANGGYVRQGTTRKQKLIDQDRMGMLSAPRRNEPQSKQVVDNHMELMEAIGNVNKTIVETRLPLVN